MQYRFEEIYADSPADREEPAQEKQHAQEEENRG